MTLIKHLEIGRHVDHDGVEHVVVDGYDSGLSRIVGLVPVEEYDPRRFGFPQATRWHSFSPLDELPTRPEPAEGYQLYVVRYGDGLRTAALPLGPATRLRDRLRDEGYPGAELDEAELARWRPAP
jgi:hypothetical protein